MGAYSFLSRKVGEKVAEEMIQNGKIYTAAELYDMGIVNKLADDRRSKEELLNYIKSETSAQRVQDAICKVRQCVNPIQLDELRHITDIWVDLTLRLSPSDINKMERFVKAQRRRFERVRS